MASNAIKNSDEDEAFAINLTPMIDVVFQLIIFFMCAMKFKTLEMKIEAFLPKDRGLAKTPEVIEEVVQIKVELRQEQNEGVPHFKMFEAEIRPDLGVGVRPLPRTPGKTATSKEREAYDLAVKQHFNRYVQPKLAEIEEKIRKYLSEDPTLPCQIDSGRYVRHEYVIGVLDTFLKACHLEGIDEPEITFIGTPPPRPGD